MANRHYCDFCDQPVVFKDLHALRVAGTDLDAAPLDACRVCAEKILGLLLFTDARRRSSTVK